MNSPRGHEGFVAALRSGLRSLRVNDERILVAVSGGADSVALLRGLRQLQDCDNRSSDSHGIEIVVGHVNHQLRGAASDADAEWVRDVATSFGVECVIVRGRIDRESAGQSIESAARQMRYQLLIEIAAQHGCTAIAVAHTADDQAETVLHHLIRGTGIAGLRGIPRERSLATGVRLIRPMLEISRSDVEQWLLSLSQDYRTDHTNADTGFTRNRIRHDLLPLLEAEFNPQIRRVLQTLSVQADETAAWLRAAAMTLAGQVEQVSDDLVLRIDCAGLADAPPVLVREAIHVIWERHAWPRRSMGFREWQALASLAQLDRQPEGDRPADIDRPDEVADQADRSSGHNTPPLPALTAITLPGNIDARRRGTLLVLTRPGPD